MKLSKIFTSDYWWHFFKGWGAFRLFLIKGVRIAKASIRGFNDDQCNDKASALTFYSLLSIVPVLAVAFGIAKGFGFQQILEKEIRQRFSEQREVVDRLIDFSYNMLQNTQSGVIAGVGLVVLFWSVLKLLGNIESSFNAIWKVQQPRSMMRRFSDYLAMMVFCPIFFAASSSLSLFVFTELSNLSNTNGMWSTLSPMILFLFHLFPLLISWILFTALYYIMPNTKVPFIHALAAGIIAGSAYQIVQWIYIQFQIGLASYGAIYGSFAALPLFLVWLNTSWLIALVGAEIAYHSENELTIGVFALQPDQRHADARLLGLLVMQQAIRAFVKGEPPPTPYQFAKRSGVSVVGIRRIIQPLIEAGLLVEVYWKDGSNGRYQPGRSPKDVTIKAVCAALDTSREQQYAIMDDQETELTKKMLAEFDALLDEPEVNQSLEYNALVGKDGK